jgi:acyl-CoA thioester hydrolase
MTADRLPSQEAASGSGVHQLAVRVYYEDTDAVGVVYHSNYLHFAERARTEMLRALGLQPSRLWAEDGIGFMVRRCVADFLAPARLDDALIVESRLRELRGASLDLDQTVRREGLELVRLQVKLACLTTDGRPARLPARVRAALGKFSDNLWQDDGKQRG